jgi:hypothetical protein
MRHLRKFLIIGSFATAGCGRSVVPYSPAEVVEPEVSLEELGRDAGVPAGVEVPEGGSAGVDAGSGPTAEVPIPGAPDAGPPPALVCTSNRFYATDDGEEEGSASMRPGGQCVGCHRRTGDGPELLFGGTVYPTLFERNDCNGAPLAGGSVELTDGAGVVVSAPINNAGNFFTRLNAAFAFPARVRVLASGRERRMLSPAPHGDCNVCHTERGASGAPGRVLAP